MNEHLRVKCRYMRVPEAAEYCGLSASTLAKRRLRGVPPRFRKLGPRVVAYAVEDLDAWLADCVRNSTSEAAPS